MPRREKKLIERAYTPGSATGLAVWCGDAAGPLQAVPQPGRSWRPRGRPATRPHEHVRGGTAKIPTPFQPATGRVRLRPVTGGTNAVLPGWLKETLAAIVAAPPAATPPDPIADRAVWQGWQNGLAAPLTPPADLPPLRLPPVWDNLAGHRTPEMVLRLCAHGIMPLYTPLGGSRLNMAESMQRILKRRALDGQHTPARPGRDRRLARADGAGLEPAPHALRVGRQARAAAAKTAR